MDKKFAALLTAVGLTATLLTGCSAIEPAEYPDVEVSTTETRAHVFGHNGYKPGKVNVIHNEDDNTYTVTIQYNPPTDYRSSK